MSKAINTLVINAMGAAANFAARVDALRAALPAETIADHTALLDALRPGVAQYRGITLTEKSTGRLVFPADHDKTEAAKKDLQRLAKAVMGPVVHQKAEAAPMRFNAAQKAAAAQLLAACGGDMARVRAVIKAVQA